MPQECETCTEHSGIEVRTTRNEQDIQSLYGKFGESISLMYKIDKRLEGLWAKVTGIVIGASFIMGLVFRFADKIKLP